jgi:uncharacterized protein (TIGR02145 family)
MRNKILLFLIVLFSVLNAQTFTNTYTTMNVYFNNRPTVQYPINAIDTITYSVNPSVCPATVQDTDGNIYNVVQIGMQCWMKENLNTSHYRDGGIIPNGLNNSTWSNANYGACSDYNNDTAMATIYGKLYNTYVAQHLPSVCPQGWHVPDEVDWNELHKFIDTAMASTNYSSLVGSGIKEVGLVHWAIPNDGATNYWGFTALPAGKRNEIGVFSEINTNGYFWTSSFDPYTSDAYCRKLFYDRSTIYVYSESNYNIGYSIRCIKD